MSADQLRVCTLEYNCDGCPAKWLSDTTKLNMGMVIEAALRDFSPEDMQPIAAEAVELASPGRATFKDSKVTGAIIQASLRIADNECHPYVREVKPVPPKRIYEGSFLKRVINRLRSK